MPTRLLREGINDSKAVNSLSDSGEIFYRRLVSVVDDFGRFEADPEILRGELFKRKLDEWPIARVEEALHECSETKTQDSLPLVMVYEIGARRFLEIQNFGQRIRSKSKYPEPTARQVLNEYRREVPQPADNCAQMSADCGEVRPYAEAYAYSDSKAKTDAEASAKPQRAPAPVLAMPTGPDYHARYEALYAKHPVPGFKAEGQTRYLEILSSAVHSENVAGAIDRSHAEWCEFWATSPTEFRPGIGKWFEDGYYLRKPKARDSPAARSRPQGNAEAWSRA